MKTQWKCEPQAENLLVKILDEDLRISQSLQELENLLLEQTSTRLFDWVDHLVIRRTPAREAELSEAGFVADKRHSWAGHTVMYHPGALLPRVCLAETSGEGVAVRVDSIADFLSVRGMSASIEGSALSSYRRALVWTEGDVSTWVVERRDSWIMQPTSKAPDAAQRYLEGLELWQTRPRDLEDEDACMVAAQERAERLVEMLGPDMAAWVVHEAERHYWQSRNTAGQIQKLRQDRLGMGWANHDHHTYRSSRRHFGKLIHLMQTLGFECRERFFAGKEAGWGAQVMENSNANLVLFLDVDLEPEEIQVDFVNEELTERDHLGTVGLWCALHGDSVLKAGMHHLEGQFAFEQLSTDLEAWGIGMMDPFSNFSYLKQAFTKGERWPVDSHRVERLLESGLITDEQGKEFLSHGAVGSHLENLQRREGYKGFNQKNVSWIIEHTDPRSIR